MDRRFKVRKQEMLEECEVSLSNATKNQPIWQGGWKSVAGLLAGSR